MKFFKKLKSTFWGDEKVKGGSALFVLFVTLSATATVLSNVLANKLFPVFGWEINGQMVTLTCGVLVFPITYILSDVFSDVYGYSASRRATWISFAMNFLAVLLFWLADCIPAVVWQGTKSDAGTFANAFHQVLGIDFSPNANSPIGAWGPFGTVIAGLIAYIIGSWVDDLVFEGIRKATAKKYKGENNEKTLPFILRAIASSFAGELCDSLIFIPLMYFFGGMISHYTFWTIIVICLLQCSIKTAYELVISPVTHIIAKAARKYERTHTAELTVRED